MAAIGLTSLARVDDGGRVRFRILENPQGELVLSRPDDEPPSGYRPLDGVDCMRLAAAALERPGVVVENDRGDYVVLVDASPDANAHIPLDLDDAGFLAAPAPPVARFGRRDDDEIELTPWAPDQQVDVFDPGADGFTDVPVVVLAGDDLVVERGDVDPRLASLVRDRLVDLDEPGARYGVFTNAFGEFICVAVGEALEPHEDVRAQTVIRTSGLADGASSLGEAAVWLRAFADRLEAAEAAGWTLSQPIAGGHGFPERAPA